MPSGSTGRYHYDTDFAMYAMALANREYPRMRLAVGSCIEDGGNKVQVADMNPETKTFDFQTEIEHPFPVTKLMWGTESRSNMLISTTTSVHQYKYEEDTGKLVVVGKLNCARLPSGLANSSKNRPALTSFDWSRTDPAKIGTSSVDTTCTIWNLEKQKMETQLIAHDKAVYDIVFSKHASLFASCGADGSVRLFDQRNLDHSTIIYEAATPSPLLRLAWNSLNTNQIATFAMDTTGIVLIDIRRPNGAVVTMQYHDSCVNAIAWAPHSRNHILCGTDDGRALIWDVTESTSGAASAPKWGSSAVASSSNPPAAADSSSGADAFIWYDTNMRIYQAQWPTAQTDCVAIGGTNRVTVLPV